LENYVDGLRPNIIINCVGLIKQDIRVNDHLQTILVNALLPHQINSLCRRYNSRLIHISTDCVFSGKKGNYLESDFCDGDDLYGRSKYLGELSASANAITLRTSIIGHELFSNSSLLEWFLAQSGEVQGFSRAIFSGLTTLEIAKVIFDFLVSPKLQKSIFFPVFVSKLMSHFSRIFGPAMDSATSTGIFNLLGIPCVKYPIKPIDIKNKLPVKPYMNILFLKDKWFHDDLRFSLIHKDYSIIN
jgi:dTDP-4-dehydrorhamnose reductase